MNAIPKPPIEIKEIPGGFIVPADTHIGKWQIECGKLVHDNFLPSEICKNIKPGNSVLDIGAFDGDHTLAYSNAVGENGYVCAVEAGNTAFYCLLHNTENFPIRNVEPLNCVMWNEMWKRFKHLPDENLGASTVEETSGHEMLSSMTIDRLEEMRHKEFDLIKIDAEGCEGIILDGAKKCLERGTTIFVIEINRGALLKNKTTAENVFSRLEHYAYKWEIMEPECNIDSEQYDILTMKF